MGIFTKAVMTVARGLGLRDRRLYQFLGTETEAGESISVDSSLQLSTVWACVRLISQTIATLPLHVFRGSDDGSGEIYRDHPLYRLIHERPNADMTAVEFWEAVVSHILLWGNAFIAIGRVGGRIAALTPMRPDQVTIKREATGLLSFTYTVDGRTETYDERDVLHIKGFSLDGYMGISPISVARTSLGAARAAETASSSVFRNGMRPSGIVRAKEYLSPAQRDDARQIITSFSGAHNAGKVPLLEGGWEFQPLTIPPNDAQMLETRSFHVEELCRWFDVPPIMIGHMDKQTSWGTGVEQIMLHFYTSCLRAHLERIEQAINGKLLTPYDASRGIYVEFVIEGLLRADSAGRASYYSVMVQNGLMTRNEVRSKENLPSLPGGDELTAQSNLVPLANFAVAAAQPEEEPAPPDQLAQGAPPDPAIAQNGPAQLPIKQ